MLNTNSPATASALDADIRDFIRITGEAYASHGQGVEKTPATARQVAEKVRAPWVAGGPVMANTVESMVPTPHGNVRIRIYRPTDEARQPGLVYLHGGGWVMFSLDTHDRIMREYAGRTGITVIGIDYALAPEARFPVALEQSVSVLAHLFDNAADFGLDPDHLFMGGDSAGANLSLAAAIALRDQGRGGILKGLLLNYGAFSTDLRPEDVSRYGGPDFMLTASEMDYFWQQYLRTPEDRANPLATPLRADLTDLPPIFLCIPECDVLTGQSLQLEQRLAATGVPTQAIIYPGASHSFLEAVSISQVAGQAFDDAARWLRAYL
ncbi:MAG: alpha/beta hydrolase fold domain-containing protein [Asticcacaulis sp.]|uniref:alpha/beta hydrolase fold domain-containing protein n=1 Tax=Asticcacaulis sp. TaxID=1872648 RepID=UPI0039E59AA0